MDTIPAIFLNSRNDPIYHMTIEEYMNQTCNNVLTSLSQPSIARTTQFMETSRRRMEEPETIDQSQGASIQQFERMVHRTDKCLHSSNSFISNEIFSEIEQVKDKEVDWSILPRFDYQDSDEELLLLLDCNDEEFFELRNRDGVMTEEELIAIMDPTIDVNPSEHQKVEQMKEDDQAMVRIGEADENRTCCNQMSTGDWIKIQPAVDIQTVVELSQPTVEVSVNTSSLFYTYEDPFGRLEQKVSFSQFLEGFGASRKGRMPALNNKYSFILINLHYGITYRYYHPCFILSVGKNTRFSSK